MMYVNQKRKLGSWLIRVLFTLGAFVDEADLQMRHHAYEEAYFPFDDSIDRFEALEPRYNENQFNHLAGSLILAGRFVLAERVR